MHYGPGALHDDQGIRQYGKSGAGDLVRNGGVVDRLSLRVDVKLIANGPIAYFGNLPTAFRQVAAGWVFDADEMERVSDNRRSAHVNLNRDVFLFVDVISGNLNVEVEAPRDVGVVLHELRVGQRERLRAAIDRGVCDHVPTRIFDFEARRLIEFQLVGKLHRRDISGVDCSVRKGELRMQAKDIPLAGIPLRSASVMGLRFDFGDNAILDCLRLALRIAREGASGSSKADENEKDADHDRGQAGTAPSLVASAHLSSVSCGRYNDVAGYAKAGRLGSLPSLSATPASRLMTGPRQRQRSKGGLTAYKRALDIPFHSRLMAWEVVGPNSAPRLRDRKGRRALGMTR